MHLSSDSKRLASNMVEECEDLFSIQMASLPKVSVSIVRLEEDSMIGARRSSLSRNRHLEDLEKCSRKGSVVEKKAFFETHFEKQGAKCWNSSGDAVSPMTYNGFLVSEVTHNEECFEDSSEEEMDEKDFLVMEFGKPNGTSFYEVQTHSGVGINLQSEFDASFEEKDQEKICKHDNFGNQKLVCDEKDTKMDDILPEYDNKLEPLETAPNETEVQSPLGKKETLLQIDVKNGDELSMVNDVQLGGPNPDQSNDLTKPTSSQTVSSKATSSYKQNVAKSKIRPEAPASQVGKRAKKEKSNTAVLKAAGSKAVQINDRNASMAKPEVTSKMQHTRMSVTRNVKPESSTNVNAKVNQGRSSEKETQVKKSGHASQLLLRGKKTDKHGSTFLGSKPELAKHSVNSRNDEKPEQRNLVEEKKHAKEKKKSYPQATIQEVKEVEMEKLKNSLSFKAKPLPSFYTESAQRDNGKIKAGENPSNDKPAKQINRTSQKLSSSSKLRSGRVESASFNQSSNYSRAGRSNELAKKKETEKTSDKASSLSYQQEQPLNKNKTDAGQIKKMGMNGRGPATVAGVGNLA